MHEKNKTGSGPLIASIIIVLVIILGGIYSFTERPLKPQMETNGLIEQLQTQSASTELDAIEIDTLNTDLEEIDADLGDIDAELDLLIQGL